ncbi:MAG TPA: AI-2E family transporter [Balneolales bacterium]|nr:AI-2E family transporter [Balneolales bacterium]
MKSITFEKVVRVIVGLVLLSLMLMILYRYANLVAYALVALIMSYILDPFVNKLQAAGLNRMWSTIVVLTSVVLVLVWISTTIFPTVGGQIVELTKQLNLTNIQKVATKMDEQLHSTLPFVPQGFLRENLVKLVQRTFDLSGLSNTISNIFGIFANVFAAVIVIPFATFFFLKDGSKFRRVILQLIPNAYFETTMSILSKVETRLGYYFKSVALESFLVGLLAFVLLSFAGLKNALSVAIAIGVANSIPYFGPLLGYILSIVVAIFETGDFSLVLECLLAVLATQLTDNVVFQPFLFSRSADMHPLVILFVVFIGAETAGLVGMLVAIPIATILKITVKEIIWSINNYHVFSAEK